MVIRAVDHREAHFFARQFLRGLKPAKSGANDDHMRDRRLRFFPCNNLRIDAATGNPKFQAPNPRKASTTNIQSDPWRLLDIWSLEFPWRLGAWNLVLCRRR